MIDKKGNYISKNGLLLTDFKYEVIGNFKNTNIKQVQCSYKCKDKNLFLFIDYPEGICANQAEYIEKAKEYTKIVEKNGELYEYTEEYLKGNSMQLQTPFNYGENYLEKIEEFNKKRAIIEKRREEAARKARILEKQKEAELRAKEKEAAIKAKEKEAELRAKEKEAQAIAKEKEAQLRIKEKEKFAREAELRKIENAKLASKRAEEAKAQAFKDEKRRIIEEKEAIRLKALEDIKKAKEKAGLDKIKAKQAAREAKLAEKARLIKLKEDAKKARIAEKNKLLQAKIAAKQAKVDGKKNKSAAVAAGGNGKGKSHNGLKVALVCTSVIAAAGIGTSVYFYLTRGTGGGDTPTPTPTPTGDEVVVSFDLNGAITKQGSKTFAKVKKNTKFSAVTKPEFIAPAGSTFTNKWKIKDGSEISGDYTFTADTSIEPIFSTNTFDIKIDINGGTWVDQPGTTTSRSAGTFEYGKTWKNVLDNNSWIKENNITAPDGYKFAYIGYQSGSEYLPISNEYLLTKESTFRVCYAPLNAVTINFDLNGGTLKSGTPSTQVNYGTTWSAVTSKPEVTAPSGYTFNRWEINGAEIPSTYSFKTDTTVKAAYTINSYEVKVNINGGKWKDDETITAARSAGTFNYGTTWSEVVASTTAKDWLKADNIKAPDDTKQFSYFGYSKDGGTTYLPIYNDYVISADTEIKVIYAAKDTVTLFLDPNGGTFATGGGTDLKIVENVAKGTTWGSIKNTYVLTKESYDYKGYKKGDTVVQDTDTFESATYLKGYFEKQASKGWASDSLVMIDDYATNGVGEEGSKKYGLEALKEVYKAESITSFIGKEKTIKIDNIDYTLVVIGEEEDYLDDAKTKKATLTFQFKDIITNNDISYSTKAANSNKYEDSNLRSQLNNNFYSKIPDAIRSCIKTVKKTTAIGGEAEITTLGTYDDKIFLPSAKELGFNEVPYTYVESGETKTVKSLDEGSTYSYYNDEATQATRRGKTTDYLLRSPDFLTKYFAWSVNTEGKLGVKNGDVYESYDVTSTCSISPCFCIGGKVE